jgi:RNA polymerase sigma factor (TIGR02999 family)
MDVTDLLRRAHAGDEEAFRSVIPLVYGELKKLAASYARRHSHSGPLEVTALVHELFLRMAGREHPEYENRAHFYGIVSRLMRQLLVDLARRRSAQKRGGGVEVQLAFVEIAEARDFDRLLDLNEAFDRLAEHHPRKAQLVEMRYFGGMTAEDSATALSLPVHTVRHDLRYAQSWLRRELAV